ncbi:MAG: ferredoxin [Bradymonadaceae bacterium]
MTDDDVGAEQSGGSPPVSEKPYRVVFEGNLCIGTGRCAEVSENWSMDIRTGKGRAETHFFDEDELEHNLEAARVCPAKNGVGVIHVVDRRTGEELEPDPHGDGSLSLGKEAGKAAND